MICQSLNLTNFLEFLIVLMYFSMCRAVILLHFNWFSPIFKWRTGQSHWFFWDYSCLCCKGEDSVFYCISRAAMACWKGKPHHLIASALFSFILKSNKWHIHMHVSIHPCDPVMRFSLGHWHWVVMKSPRIKTAVCLGLCAKCFFAPSGSYAWFPSLLLPALEEAQCARAMRQCLGALRVSISVCNCVVAVW